MPCWTFGRNKWSDQLGNSKETHNTVLPQEAWEIFGLRTTLKSLHTTFLNQGPHFAFFPFWEEGGGWEGGMCGTSHDLSLRYPGQRQPHRTEYKSLTNINQHLLLLKGWIRWSLRSLSTCYSMISIYHYGSGSIKRRDDFLFGCLEGLPK